MRLLVALVVVLGSAPAVACATAHDRFRLTYDVGALVAADGREDVLEGSLVAGLALAYDVSGYLAVVASVARARTGADGLWEAERSLSVYDLGLQAQLPLRVGAVTALVPFVGAGVGGRTSDFREVGGTRETDLAAYAAVGGRVEYDLGVLAVTIRDVVSGRSGAGLTGGARRHERALVASFGARF